MRAAKRTLGRGSARTRNPAITVAPVPDISNTLHGCRDLPLLDWSFVNTSAPHLHHQLGSQASAAGGGDKLDGEEFWLPGGDSAGFARGCDRGVDRLVFRVDVRHGALQDDVHGRGRGAKNRLPTHCRTAIRQSREAGERELAARSVGSGKRLIVKTETHVPRKEGDRRSDDLLGRHLGSYFAAIFDPHPTAPH